jgi:hypothetical protein
MIQRAFETHEKELLRASETPKELLKLQKSF